MKKLNLYTFTFAVLLTLFCTNLFARSNAKPKPYVNVSKDYSIIFPQKWKVSEADENTVAATYLRSFGKVSMNIVKQHIDIDTKELKKVNMTETMGKALSELFKNSTRKGQRKLDDDPAFWHIIELEIPQGDKTVSVVMYQVAGFYKNDIFLITCSATDETKELANSKLKHYRPIFLESIKSFRFLKKRVVRKQQKIYAFLSFILCLGLSFVLRVLVFKRPFNVFVCLAISIVVSGLSFGTLFLFLNTKSFFLGGSMIFLSCFYFLGPYFESKWDRQK